MRRLLKGWVCLAGFMAVLLPLAFFTGCDSEVGNVAVAGVAITPAGQVNLAPGAHQQLNAAVTPGNATDPSVIWESSNNDVVTVSEAGRVDAVAVGAAFITVTTLDGGFYYQVLVNVVGAADRANLAAAIADANALLNNTEPSADGTDVGLDDYWALLAAVTAFTNAIGVAQGVYNNPDATQFAMTSAIIVLRGAYNTFNAARGLGTYGFADRTVLVAAISEANALLGDTVMAEDGDDIMYTYYWANEAAFNAFTAAINVAQGVYDTHNSTQAAVDGAVGALGAAVALFDDARLPGLLLIARITWQELRNNFMAVGGGHGGPPVTTTVLPNGITQTGRTANHNGIGLNVVSLRATFGDGDIVFTGTIAGEGNFQLLRGGGGWGEGAIWGGTPTGFTIPAAEVFAAGSAHRIITNPGTADFTITGVTVGGHNIIR